MPKRDATKESTNRHAVKYGCERGNEETRKRENEETEKQSGRMGTRKRVDGRGVCPGQGCVSGTRGFFVAGFVVVSTLQLRHAASRDGRKYKVWKIYRDSNGSVYGAAYGVWHF